MAKTIIIDLKPVIKLSLFLHIGITLAFAALKLLLQMDVVFFKIRVYIILYMVFIVFAHEFLHGVGFRYIGKAPWENIKYGFHRKHRTPYCTCKDLITGRNKFIGIILLPTIVLGIITTVIAIYSYNLFWTFVLGLVISAGAGDFYMARDVYKYPKTYKFMDHPTEPGYIIFEE